MVGVAPGIHIHTITLEDEVGLHGVVLIVDAVLARGVEVELSELVRAAGGDEGAVGQDNLETRAQVLELGLIGLGDVETHRLGAGVVNVVGIDDDRRLPLALGAGRVGAVQAVPVERTASVGVVEAVDINGAIGGPGHERGAVEA